MSSSDLTNQLQKPLGRKAYGSIPHLPGSRRGPADRGLNDGQAAILTVKARDGLDRIVVQEKLDGSCVAVAKVDGQIVALGRSGYLADSSPYPQHQAFVRWVKLNEAKFSEILEEGHRLCGEWLYQAHGTLYNLPHEPFVAFDYMQGDERRTADEVRATCDLVGIVTPRVIHDGVPISIEAVLAKLNPSGHGAIGDVEGAVWRCERNGRTDFLGKYVRTDKEDGMYLERVSGGAPFINLMHGKEIVI